MPNLQQKKKRFLINIRRVNAAKSYAEFLISQQKLVY